MDNNEKKRVLIVTQEMKPYLIESEIAQITRTLPQHIQENGMEIRVLMPRFGNINERRHRLHEVVRLSGINIPVGDEDHPLIIKVASLPGARMQVYFLDNEDLFKRKGAMREDKTQKFYDDNHERMIFFCKGVLETVKKFGWPPDIIHCHGWMTSLIPFYLKTAYKDDPVFESSKIVYSLYKNSFEESMDESFATLAPANGSSEGIENFGSANNSGLDIGAMTYSDAFVRGSEELEADLEKVIKKSKKPILTGIPEEMDKALESYQEFYNTLLEG